MIERRKVLRASLFAIAVLPPAALLVLIQRLGVNVPYLDDWDTFTVLAKWHEGTVSFADFWEQHSEHRIPSLRLLIWLLGVLSRYNLVIEMLVGFVFAVLALPIVWALLRRTLKDHAPGLIAPMTAVASLLLFSLMLHENWFSGTASLQLFLLRLVSTVLVWALVRRPGDVASMAVAVCCAIVGMFAEAAGLALWVTGGLAIWMTNEKGPRRARLLTVWTVVACVMVVAYLRGLDWDVSDLWEGSLRAYRFVSFSAASLGLPFAYGTNADRSAAVGVAGCAALAAAVVWMARSRRDVLHAVVPMLLLAAQGLFGAVLIGLGRSGLEPKYAMTSHYAFGSSQFWIATIAVVWVAILIRRPWIGLPGVAVKVGTAVVVFVLAAGFLNANAFAYRAAYASSRNLEMALATLYANEDPPSDVARFLYPPDESHFRRQLVRLKRLGLGPFARSAEHDKARLIARFADAESSGLRDGSFDGGDCSLTVGWAWDPRRPDRSVTVDIWHRGTRLGSAAAQWFRADLQQAGIGNGQHGFVFYFPSILELGTGETIKVTYAGTAQQLPGSPKVVMCR